MKWRFWLGMGFSILAAVLLVRGASWAEVWDALTRANLLLIVGASAIIVLMLATRAARWGVLLVALRNGASWRWLFLIVNISYLLNNALPARMGDFARAYLWGERTGVSKAATLSTVVVERVFDLLLAFGCLLLLLPFTVLPDWAFWSGIAAGLVSVLAIGLLIVMAGRPALLLAFISRLNQRFPALTRLPLLPVLKALLEGLEVLRLPRARRVVIGWSIGIVVTQLLYTYAMILALGIRVPFHAALAVLVMTSLGMAVPSAPGNLGIYHYMAAFSLELFGVERGQAVAFALLLHAVAYVVSSALGLVSAWHAGFTLSRIGSLGSVGDFAEQSPGR